MRTTPPDSIDSHRLRESALTPINGSSRKELSISNAYEPPYSEIRQNWQDDHAVVYKGLPGRINMVEPLGLFLFLGFSGQCPEKSSSFIIY